MFNNNDMVIIWAHEERGVLVGSSSGRIWYRERNAKDSELDIKYYIYFTFYILLTCTF